MGQSEARNSGAGRIVHRFFELGILIKGIDGAFELVGGLLLLLLLSEEISGIVFFFVRWELEEAPTDLVANALFI